MTRETELPCYCSQRQTLTLRNESGLRQWCCSRCGGRRLLLEDYRRFREQGGLEQLSVALPPAAADYRETATARVCQSCGLIMARYRVARDIAFHIDYCTTCQSVWLDGLEWEILAAQDWLARLDDILSDAWQKRVRQDEAQSRREQSMRTRFGDTEYEKLREFRDWLAQQPKRNEMMAFIGSDLPTRSGRST